MIFRDIKQNTDEWFALRTGLITGSDAPKVMMSDTNKGYKQLIRRLAYERLYGERADAWQGNKYTDRGHELEDEALSEYEFLTGNKIEKVGFIQLNDWIGCSPDALEGDKGLIQVKCLDWNAHMEVLESQKIETYHELQMQFELYASERDYNVYFGYHPKLPAFIKRIEVDDKIRQKLDNQITKIIEETQVLMKKLKEK